MSYNVKTIDVFERQAKRQNYLSIILLSEIMENDRVKNQHYVPKLYLRAFSYENKKKEIGFYNFKNGTRPFILEKSNENK